MTDHPRRTCPNCLMRFTVLGWQQGRNRQATSIAAMRCSVPDCGRRFHQGGHGIKGYVMEEQDLSAADRLILSEGR